MRRSLQQTGVEVLKALTPVLLTILVLNFTILHVPGRVLAHFLIGAAMIVSGIVLFLYGVKSGILPMGHDVGSELPQRGSLGFIIASSFIFGFIITAAEPGIILLGRVASDAGNGGRTGLVVVVATGLSILFTAALMRILLGFPIKYSLAIVYGLALVLAIFMPSELRSVAFDSGAVAAGPLTVPMVLALGLGFTSVLARRSTLSDGFGLIGLACAGPIIGVQILGAFF